MSNKLRYSNYLVNINTFKHFDDDYKLSLFIQDLKNEMDLFANNISEYLECDDIKSINIQLKFELGKGKYFIHAFMFIAVSYKGGLTFNKNDLEDSLFISLDLENIDLDVTHVKNKNFNL